MAYVVRSQGGAADGGGIGMRAHVEDEKAPLR